MRNQFIVSQIFLAWLFVLFCGGLYLRFERPSAEAKESPQIIQLAERMAVVAKYGQDLPEASRRQLLEAARELEPQEHLKDLIEGELPPNFDLESLSPTYKLMASDIREPSAETRRSLERVAQEGLERFTITIALLCSLLLTAISTLFSKKVESKEPQDPTELNATGVLAVFFTWDVLGFVGLALLVSLLSHFFDKFTLIMITQCSLYAFLLLLLSRSKLRPGLQVLGKFSPSWVGKGYLLALFSVFLLNYLMTSLLGASPQSENPVLQLFVGAPVWKMGILGLLVVVIGPLFEEIVFRGWLYGGLRKKWGDAWALVISSLLFALIHGDAPALPALFVLGLIFAWVYRRSGSLWTSILVHAMWNATTFSLLISVMP